MTKSETLGDYKNQPTKQLNPLGDLPNRPTERPLPDGWTWKTLGEVANPERNRVKPQNFADLQFIGMDDVESETMRLLGTKPSGEMRSSSEHFWPDDVLYGSLRPYLNKVYRPDFEGLCSAEFIVFREAPHLTSKYLQYFLNQWSFVAFINRQNTGDRPRVKFGQMADYPFPLAPLSEQERIVDEIEKQFTRLDQAVASLKRLQCNLARYKASVLKAACEGRLVPQNPNDEPAQQLLARILAERRAQWEAQEWQNLIVKAQKKAAQAQRKAQGLPARVKDLQPGEWESIPEADCARYLPKNDKWKEKYKEPRGVETAELPELPEGWVWVNADHVCDPIANGSTPKSHKMYADNGEVPFLKVYNLTHDGSLDFSIKPTFIDKETHVGKLSRSILYPGDVLMNIVGPPLGKVSIVTDKYPEWNMNQAIVSFRPILPELNNRFLSYVFLAPTSSMQLLYKTSKTTAGQRNLNVSACRRMIFPLPPANEQKRIVAEVERRLSVITATEQAITTNLARAERLRQSILHRAFTGRLV